MEPNKQKSNQPAAAKARQIDENLRKIYDEALSEELPDRFHDLLAQLKAGHKDTSDGH